MIGIIAELSKEKRCLELNYTSSFNPTEWCQDRLKLVVNFFFLLLCEVDPNEYISDAYRVCNMIDQMYGAKNKMLILQQSLCHNLVAYSLSDSKLLLKLNTSCMPCGSYTYLKK